MKKRIVCISFVLMISVLATTCFSKPPSIASVERRFENNYKDIQTVVEFMANSGYKSIILKGNDGTMRADLEIVTIDDESVCDAVECLLGSYGAYQSIYMRNNTVTIRQWRGLTDIGCGIAYSTNKTDAPYVDYATELKPLSREGWYYYVDDYNAWRTGKRP